MRRSDDGVFNDFVAVPQVIGEHCGTVEAQADVEPHTRGSPMRLFFVLILALLPQMAFAQTCNVDLARVEEAIADLEGSYGDVPSSIDCDAPLNPAQTMICASAATSPAVLWRMSRLNDMAWVYAYENATKNDVDNANPPPDHHTAPALAACTDEACVCAVLIENTTGNRGSSMTPYAE